MLLSHSPGFFLFFLAAFEEAVQKTKIETTGENPKQGNPEYYESPVTVD